MDMPLRGPRCTSGNTLTSAKRVRRVLDGKKVDRIPVFFWHHFRQAGTGERLAELTVDFFVNKFHLDIIKIMPDIPYPVEKNSIRNAQELSFLPLLKRDASFYKEQLVCIKRIRSYVGPDYPLLLTLFSPLSFALRFIGKKKGIMEARANPEDFRRGLEIIASNLLWFTKEVMKVGASGLFFSCMGATAAGFTRKEYEMFGRQYDLMVLDKACPGWLNVLHLHTEPDQHGVELYIDMFKDYPVVSISWSDRLNGPGLKMMRKMTNKCLMGGLSEKGPLVTGGEKDIKKEIIDARFQTEDRNLILACGCSLPDDANEKWLHTAREYLDNF